MTPNLWFSILLLLLMLLNVGCSVGYNSVDHESDSVASVTTTRASVVSVTINELPDNTTTIATRDITRPLGPAWIDQQRWINPTIDTEDAKWFELYRDYILINPNDISTPMGALCWAHHEVERAIARYITRDILDSDIIPIYVKALGLTTDQIGSKAQATEALLSLFADQGDGDAGSVSNIDSNSDTSNNAGPVDISKDDLNISDESFAVLKYGWDSSVVPLDEIGGDGTEWLGLFQEVAKPEIVAATQAGGGLPASVQKFADALFEAVNEYLDGTRTDLSDSRGLSNTLSNWEQFVEEAKYSQDCQRAWLAEVTTNGLETQPLGGDTSISSLPRAGIDTTTTTEENEEIFVVDDSNISTTVAEFITTTLTTTTTSLDARSLSNSWLESISINNYDGSLENDRLREEYWLNNPNSLSTPMGAYCWAYHEIRRAIWRLLTYTTLVPHMEWVMDKLDITVAQVGEAGPSRNTALLDILAEGSDQYPAPDQLDSIENTNLSDDELALIWFHSDHFIEHYRIENRIAGNGTEWYDAIRAVAKPEVITAIRAGDGLPAAVVPYADRFFKAVNRLAVDNRPARDSDYNADVYSAFQLPDPLPADVVAFYEEAKYSPDCKRAFFPSSFIGNNHG